MWFLVCDFSPLFSQTNLHENVGSQIKGYFIFIFINWAGCYILIDAFISLICKKFYTEHIN